jgi:hypothetical protein
MAGILELSRSIIESQQGLYSNAYKFSAKARLTIWNVAGNFFAGCQIFAQWSFMRPMAKDQYKGKKSRRAPAKPSRVGYSLKRHMPAVGRCTRPLDVTQRRLLPQALDEILSR